MVLTAIPSQQVTGFEFSNTLDRAILQTVAYADVFDFPVNAREIHRYLIGVQASLSQVIAALHNPGLDRICIEQHDQFFTLPGRGDLLQVRAYRSKIAGRMLPDALKFGKSISRLPFVRMVALTGALAVDNVEPGSDYDYLIVTQPGRLWVCRAIVNVFVRRISLNKKTICPNYFLSEEALVFPEQNLYAAHELTQMIPLSGFDIYQRIRASNTWADHYLPNARSTPQLNGMLPATRKFPAASRIMNLAESLLSCQLGSTVDQWEMKRKIRKFNSRIHEYSEAEFGPDLCKGHFNNHGLHVMNAFEQRLKQFENFQVNTSYD